MTTATRARSALAFRPRGRGRPRRTALGVGARGAAVSGFPLLAGCPLLTAGLVLYWLPLLRVEPDAMNGYGLISVLPVATLLGAVVLTTTFVITLARPRPHRTLLTVQVVATVLSLHALAPAVEPIARFPTAWQHAGIIEYITRTHGVDTLLDARFNWPGFFALVGFVTRAIGQDDLEPVLHWAPVITNLLYLGPFFLILRTLRASWRAKWFAAWLFPVLNWVGQDYLSPQAFGYLLYLCWIAILVTWFRPAASAPGRPARRTGRLARLTGRIRAAGPMEAGELPPRTTAAERPILLLLLVAIFAVATASHQLTPFLMIAGAAGLVVAGRCTPRSLPILGAVIFGAWISFMTRGFWAGHLDEVFGGVGRLGANLSSSVEGRISEGSPQLANVQQARVVLAALVAGLALLGLLRRRRLRLTDRVALVLLLAPLSTFGLQSYGGEVALRTYFFLLPGACILIAYLFFPEPVAARLRLRRATAGCAAVVALVFVFGFLLVRFGNERFEQVRPGEVTAFDVLLDRRPAGLIDVVWLTAEDTTASGFPVMPWGHRDYERLSYPVVDSTRDPARDAHAITAALHAHGPAAFFVTTRGHEAYMELSSGLPAGYGDRLRAALARSPGLRVVYADRDAAVFAPRSPPRGQGPPVPRPTPLRVDMTSWTPAGVVYFPVLVGMLIARELRRLRSPPLSSPDSPPGSPPAERRRLLSNTMLVLPMLAALLAIIADRFLSLG